MYTKNTPRKHVCFACSMFTSCSGHGPYNMLMYFGGKYPYRFKQANTIVYCCIFYMNIYMNLYKNIQTYTLFN